MEDDDWPIPKQSKSIESLFSLANTNYKNKKYDNALTWYGIILERAEKGSDESADSKYAFIKSLYMISRCHMEKENCKQALDIAHIVSDLVISNCPENIHFPEQLIIEIKERLDDVVGAFILAIIFKQLHPSNKKCEEILSGVQAKVQESFTKSRSSIDQIFSVLTTKGKQFYETKEYSTAVAFFKKIIEVFHFLPDDLLRVVYIGLSKCLFKIGDLDEAERNVIKVLQRFPLLTKARKLHQKIANAKKVKSKVQNATQPPAEIKQKQQPQHQHEGSMPASTKNEAKGTVRKQEKTTPKTGVASGNVFHKKACNGKGSTWEGLPRKELPKPTNTSKGQPEAINRFSDSFKSVNRNKFSPLVVHEESTAKCDPSSGSPVAQPVLRKESTDAEERVPQDKSQSESSDETPFQPIKKRKQHEKQNASEGKVEKAFRLPKGVEVICEHFRREVFAHPQNSSKIPKCCQACKAMKSCNYMYFRQDLKQWTTVRNIPDNMCGTGKQIRICELFLNGKTHDSNCTFAHGPELQMWDLQRKGVLPSSETYLRNLERPPGSTVTNPLSRKAPAETARKPSVKQTSARPTFTRQNLNPERPISVNKTPIQTPLEYQHSTNTVHIPSGVKIVCNHFIKERKYYQMRSDSKTYICRACWNKCRRDVEDRPVSYAFWSAGFKEWRLIRPYPKEVRHVAFRPCQDFKRNKPCVKKNCTFAHGPELSMWAMERGGLVPPWKAMFLTIVYGTVDQVVLRQLPLGAIEEDLRLCKSVESRNFCRFGRGCRYPHSTLELDNWKKSYGDKIKELRLKNQESTTTPHSSQTLMHHDLKLTESMQGVELSCHPDDPNVQLAEDCDNHTYSWEFCARFKATSLLPAVELQYHRQYFHFTNVCVLGFDKESNESVTIRSETLNVTYIPQYSVRLDSKIQTIEFQVTVSFQASVFGSFTQRILFNFGCQPFLKKEFNIDIDNKEVLDKLTDVREAVNLEALSWDDGNVIVIRCEPNPEEDKFLSTYSLPKDTKGIVSAQLFKQEIRKDSYKQTMHQLLFAEEVYMRELLLKLTPTNVKLHALTAKPSRLDGTEFAKPGHLFGSIELQIQITLDDMAGRVCLRNVQSILIRSPDKPKYVYELSSEIYGGNKIFVDLTPNVCKDLKINQQSIVDVEMRFNLNRSILCLMHKAVDSLGNTHATQLFPVKQATITRKQMLIGLEWIDQRLNDCQKRIIQEIAEVMPPSPPLVVFGPFGTGKTFTFNKAILYLMLEKTNRVLLCTHTNSAADIHVELLDEYLSGREKGKLVHSAKPLRIYSPETELKKTPSVSRKYALIKDDIFVMPTRRNIVDHRVVITTLTTADLLTKLNVHHGFFTHILIDEAAQAWETEALIPIALAGPNTKVVFTGDHMQMSPEVYSKFALQGGLQKSLPERLFDHYHTIDNKEDQVLYLFENYRSTEEILRFSSEDVYGGELVAKGNIPSHPVLPPLIFYSAKGKDEKKIDNSYLNSSEVYEVEKRVAELIKEWPICWGEKKLQDIAVVTPYKYQVDAIRGVLRRKGMSEVNVQTVHNVQGREYRALFISTVRTWNSIEDSSIQPDNLSLEFLSDPKLLITAVTRAKSLVAVVGDPFALCTLGKCRSLWSDYILRCNNLNGLFGTTWINLTKEVEDHFRSIQPRLDPEAAPFVPRSQIRDNDEKQHSDAKHITSNVKKELKSHDNDISKSDLFIEQEDEQDQTSSCSGDILDDTEDEECYGFAEDSLEDQAVLQIDIDRIIEELCKFIKIHQGKTALLDEEFPVLTKNTSKVKETPTKWPSKTSSKGFDVESLPSRDYRIVIRNGKPQIQLLNIYENPSERVQEIERKTCKQQNLEAEVLAHLLESDPSKYECGQLRIATEKSRTAYLVIPDKKKPDVEIKGSIRHVFDRDTVVVEVTQSKKIMGVLNHIINPRERQYVCKVDPKNPSLMIPISKSVTSIVNLSDKNLKDIIPVYKKPKTQNEKASRVRSITTKEVMEKKLLFVVEFLQWRSDCSYPLGIAVRTISTGETFERCKHIIFAECGIRRSFSKKTEEMIRQSFPTCTIPVSEAKKRKKINNAFTIDPPESKDLDDAVSIEKLSEKGNFRVGVHIADVSFYVQNGSDLDREAKQRGVSYYPSIEGEENIPMLPTILSENLLSLLPNQDRLTVSVFVTIDNEGKALGQPVIERTVTRSCCRLSYSQAQEIIDEVNGEARDIPDIVRWGILQLHRLVMKRRHLRLGEMCLDHANDREDTDAHELIEELMILANHTVGNFLHRQNPNGVPFRTQLQPKVHRLNEWATNYGSFAKYSPALKPQLESEDITSEVKKRIDLDEKEIGIHKHVWNEISKAVESRDYRKVERLMSDPMSSPQFATASLHLRRIQTRSQYTCSGSDTKHHSLGLSNYVHFTSPIRRYIDIEVHRLLLTLISGNVCSEQHLLSEDDMATLCRRSTYFKDNSGKFEKEFQRIHFASTMKKKIQRGEFFIDQIEKCFFTIYPVNPDQDHFLSKHRKIRFDDLSPYSKSDNVDGKPETTLTWRLRIYIGPDKDNSDPPHSMDAAKIKNIVDDKDNVRVQTLQGKTWMRILEAVKERKPPDQLIPLLQVRDVMTQKNPMKSGSKCISRDVYKHPNFGRRSNTMIRNNDGHFREIAMDLKQFSIVDFQLFSNMYREMICPGVQLLKVSGICICLEHRRYHRRCFAFDPKLCASKQKYESIDEYVWFWKPVLAIEASNSAVNRNDGFILKSLRVRWSQNDDGEIEGKFRLKQSYCKSRQIQFHNGDLACVKIPLQSEDSSQYPVNSEATATNGGTGLWIGHCIVRTKKTNACAAPVTVTVRIHQMASEFPQQMLTESQRECELEIIYQPLPLRRMFTALNIELKKSSDLVQTICLGESPSAETLFPIPNEDLSLAAHYKRSGFQPLNEYQKKAVQEALESPFSLIQGPPGTGKTVTGVHITYWFAKENQKLKSGVKQKDITKGKKDEHKAPPQVLYCGPSNKSVDVVTEYLLRIPEMKNKILRVHGTLIEESEYPIPNKIMSAKPHASEDELRIPGQKVKDVSLHHFIRSNISPYSEKLNKMEKEFEEAKIKKEKPNEEDVKNYCLTIDEAEEWAFKEAGKEIILCTCSRAGSITITSRCDNIQQCIIDECGMCMEPEVLVPMTSSKAKQFVLIGDHKQLQPIVTDQQAKRLGLEISMFERLSSKAMMLEIQYRMHPSICEFPSKRFYNGKLKTPEVVRTRKTANVKIWPALDKGVTMAFCHIEGVEESSVISTAESGVGSKYNKKEAEKAVQVAKYLVNKHKTQIQKKDVVILTPYRQQRKVIQDLLKGPYEDIHITTIIKSQGSEWNYVILSLVRSLPEEELQSEPSSLWLDEHLGFITDDHQINVALTRAKHGLCIIGNKTLLSCDETWSSLIRHCEENNCVVHGAWPWENDVYQPFSMD